MDVILLEDKPFPLSLMRARVNPHDNNGDNNEEDEDISDDDEERFVAKLNLILLKKTIETTRKNGLLDENNSSWDVLLSAGFNLDFVFTVTPIQEPQWNQSSAFYVNFYGRKIRSMLQHYLVEEKVDMAKTEVTLNVEFDFKDPGVFECPNFHVLDVGPIQTSCYEYQQHFRTELGLSEAFAQKLFHFINRTITVRLTVGLSISCNDVKLPIHDDARMQTLNKKILLEKVLCDFTLVAANGTEVGCHKMMLQSTSPFFEKMFQTECQEMKDNKCKLDLSEDGLNALLKFLYCSELTKPMENSSVALELLEISHELQIPDLEATMKQLVIANLGNDDWLDFTGAFRLFLRCTRLDLEGYDEMKEKAVKAIKT
ncbi:Kelch-like protein 2 [Orchesella cincta]|uniref:Kelch-like protein 2 n=1 Tax=Orchesella cincta TaxID=48709 RepID=A0A1D2MJB5_ORCCI|nr:Kelch-like protein 2 [Orchesella cincta]